MSVDLSSLKPDKVVDARGTACPGPLLEAKRAIADLAPGAILEVQSSDEGTNDDLPLWAENAGHDFLGVIEEAGFWRLFVKKAEE
ncbi:Sulfurtransferase TusA [Dissulfuribacter thermophilus]|uniref:Sulfurtransferase TusA n=1 Tax=Dissulfuribacter thermophilus TaxID=1156395 RepID=A0A1B9F5G1_9BACT|nr:sulfurtransferase TusA family protein [Dissulfuribacter thermophilus]OCC15188.1 Sulfurtransferase TusA [Dissulfuribacter thermophilus]